MSWTFGLCALDGTNIGEILNAYERNLKLLLNGLPTASVKLRLDDLLVDEIISRSGDCLLKVYQDSTLRFIGDLTSAEEVAGEEGATMACNFAGPMWRLQKRMIGIPYPYAQANFSTPTAANTIFDFYIQQTNQNEDTGIRLGTRDTFYKITTGTESSWVFKPIAEALTETQEAKVPFPASEPPTASLLGKDDFTTGTVGEALGTRSDELANAWTTGGTATDFTWAGGGLMMRQVTSDVEGRLAINGAADHVDVSVSVDWLYPSHGSNVYADAMASGVIARATTDRNNWLRAHTTFNAGAGAAALVVQKRVGGAGAETLSTTALPTDFFFSANTWYKVGLLVTSSGDWAAYVWDASQLGTPVMVASGYDADLATGGDLATGKCGFYDNCGVGSGTRDRYYDTYRQADFSGPQSFDFEFAPSEPTADLNQSGVVGAGLKIASFNMRSQIGASKPNVVFEFGGGSRSMRSYRRLIDRQGLLNAAYSVPSDLTTDAVRSASDQASIDARGMYEETVSSDVQDAQLRQALVDAHVAIRKTPRQIITFEPSANAPEVFTDYIVGDYVTGRAVYNGTVRFNGTFRVYGVEVILDDEGKENVVPMLVPA